MREVKVILGLDDVFTIQAGDVVVGRFKTREVAFDRANAYADANGYDRPSGMYMV